MPIPTKTHTSPTTSIPETPTPSGDELLIRQPETADGAAMWSLARDGGELDLNSSYAYLMLARDFASTCRVAISGAEVVGYLIGYRPPERPTHVFVWQVAVRGDQRGRRVAARMMTDLVDALPEVEALEATVEEANTASRALFASFARSRGADLTWTEGLRASDFPDDHDAEPLLLISPLAGS